MNLRTLLSTTLLALACLLGACSDDTVDPRPQADRTVLTYFAVKNGNSLNTYLQRNIADMYLGLAGMDKQATLLIYWDGTESDDLWPRPCLLRYTTDGRGRVNGTKGLRTVTDILQAAEIVREYDQHNSVDPQIVTRILGDMGAAAPTHNLALLIGAHGSGWLKHLDGAKNRSIGQDNEGKHSLEIPQLADAIGRTLSGRIDLLTFDACMMGNAETLYELRHTTRYAVASPVETTITGFPYTEILPLMYSPKTADYTVRLVDACVADQQQIYNGWCALSAFDLSAFDALASAMSHQLSTHAGDIPRCDDTRLMQYFQKSFRYGSADMLDLVSVLNGGTVPADFRTAFDRVVIHTAITTPCDVTGTWPITAAHFNGLGMYIPQGNAAGWNAYFEQAIDWHDAAGWHAVGY